VVGVTTGPVFGLNDERSVREDGDAGPDFRCVGRELPDVEDTESVGELLSTVDPRRAADV
jgi:hypothetical protein